MITHALQLMGNYWLEEIQPEDLLVLKQLPGLAEALSDDQADALTDLAVEYQRLFGFNLPPYESVFIDPSAMLNAPATARVERLYQQAGWAPPAGVRYAAPDHIGLELLALADMPQTDMLAAPPLLINHLALWAPIFLLTLERLDPHPFYARLAELTQALILETLPDNPLPPGIDPFPSLPPAPVYRGTYQPAPGQPELEVEALKGQPIQGDSLRQVLDHLLIPRQAGLYLTRQDLAAAALALELPGVVGDRGHTLKTVLQLAAQYELLSELFEQLVNLCQREISAYGDLERDNPAWAAYAKAWQQRLENTIQFLRQLDLQAMA